MYGEGDSRVLAAFQKIFGHRYQIRRSLGSGAAGRTFLAADVVRRIDVCIKLFRGGSEPPGAERDWHITSVLKHPCVNDTFTVEELDVGGGRMRAVVSRFVDGSDFGTVARRLDQVPAEKRVELMLRLLQSCFLDICRGIDACHDHGFGHGDLHERNVLVHASGTELGAVVIDFDKATFQSRNAASLESEKRAKDLRCLRRLAGFLTQDWRWHDECQALLDHHRSISEFQAALVWSTGFLGTASGKTGNRIDVHAFSQALYDIDFLEPVAPRHAGVRREVLAAVASELSVVSELEEARRTWRSRTRNQISFRLADSKPLLDPIYCYSAGYSMRSRARCLMGIDS